MRRSSVIDGLSETKREEKKAFGRLYRYVIVLRTFLVIHVCLILAILFAPSSIQSSNPDADGKQGGEYVPQNPIQDQNMIIQYGVSALNIILLIIAIVIGCKRLTNTASSRFVTIAMIKMLGMIFELVNLSFPTTTRLGLAALALAFTVTELLLLMYMEFTLRSWKQSADYDRLDRSSLSELDASREFVKHLDSWQNVQSIRRWMGDTEAMGRRLFQLTIGFLFFLTAAVFTYEFVQVVRVQDTFFSDSDLSAMNAASTSYFGATRSSNNYRVLMVVLDGTRYDRLQVHPAFRQFAADYADDMVVMESHAQLPSMSVPNWIALATGAPPELTGVMGNIAVPATAFDSIFSRAAAMDINRGLTGTPWWHDIFASSLPFLYGDGTVNAAYKTEGLSYSTADPADWKRGEVAVQALNSTGYRYELFLAHFSDVDYQGHCCGVDSEWNKADTYNLALNNKTQILRNIFNVVDNRTVVIVTADHGHMLRGGHGGIAPELRSVPLMLYLKDSNLNNMTYTGPKFNTMVQSTDVAPSLCALLGIPVPRQSVGRFIDSWLPLINSTGQLSLQLRDLWEQKKLFVSYAVNAMGRKANTPFLTTTVPTDNQGFITAINGLMDYYNSERANSIEISTARNVGVSFVIVIFIVIYAVYVCWAFTFTDIGSIFNKYNDVSSSASRTIRRFGRENRVALAWAIGIVCAFYALVIGSFLIAYNEYGYWNPNRNEIWDSTYIHTPAVIPVYLKYTLLQASVWTYILLRLFNGQYATYLTLTSAMRADTSLKGLWERGRLYTHNLFLALGFRNASSTIREGNFRMVYLIRIYLCVIAISASLFLFIVAASWTFFCPLIFRIRFVTEFNWLVRFRVLSVQLMSLPLLAGAFHQLRSLPKSTLSSDLFDAIYFMRVARDAHTRQVDAVELLNLTPDSADSSSGRNISKLNLALVHSELSDERFLIHRKAQSIQALSESIRALDGTPSLDSVHKPEVVVAIQGGLPHIVPAPLAAAAAAAKSL